MILNLTDNVLISPSAVAIHSKISNLFQGATCPFKHKKIKELCRYHMNRGCEKNLDGMCPKMHGKPCLHESWRARVFSPLVSWSNENKSCMRVDES